jgi:hypothetical protein
MYRRLLASGLILVLSACASAGAGDGPPAASAGSQATITREEIAASGLTNMEEVITRLRPQYLRSRGQSSLRGPPDQAAVYMDFTHLGGPTSLRGIIASAVLRVEYISGPDTSYRFGMNHPAGVIHVITRN